MTLQYLEIIAWPGLSLSCRRANGNRVGFLASQFHDKRLSTFFKLNFNGFSFRLSTHANKGTRIGGRRVGVEWVLKRSRVTRVRQLPPTSAHPPALLWPPPGDIRAGKQKDLTQRPLFHLKLNWRFDALEKIHHY